MMVFDQRGQQVGEQHNATPRRLLRRLLPILQDYRRLADDAYAIPHVHIAKLNAVDALITEVEEALDGE